MSLVSNFPTQVLNALDSILTGLSGTVPAAVSPGNFEARLLQLTGAIALRLGLTLPSAANPGNFDERFLQLLRSISLLLGGSPFASAPSNPSVLVLNQLEQILLGFGGTVPAAVIPGNFDERFLQLLKAIVTASSGYTVTPPASARLTWTAQNSNSYTYYDLGSTNTTMAMLHNFVINENGSVSGMMANDGEMFIHARLAASATITSLALWSGQFNGLFHAPNSIQLYPGFVTAVGSTLYSGSPISTSTQQIFTLPAGIIGTDFTIRLTSATGFISVMELEIYGY
jgi:hypothetical protein